MARVFHLPIQLTLIYEITLHISHLGFFVLLASDHLNFWYALPLYTIKFIAFSLILSLSILFYHLLSKEMKHTLKSTPPLGILSFFFLGPFSSVFISIWSFSYGLLFICSLFHYYCVSNIFLVTFLCFHLIFILELD